MTSRDEILALFADKLDRTGSLDAAFLKAIWNAYKRGYEDGKNDHATDTDNTGWNIVS